MRTSDLVDAKLALWVARAVKVKTPGDRLLYAAGGCLFVETQWGGGEPFSYRPDCRWSDGGPLIEQYRIELLPNGVTWTALLHRHGYADRSPLVAAMRALVASVYGDTVPEVAP